MRQQISENPGIEKIRQEMLTAWQEGNGGSADEIHLFEGQEGIVLMIPKAFYQAELDLHRATTGGGKVLNQYLRTLLQTAAADFIPKLEKVLGKKISEIVPLLDLQAGWAIAIYRYQSSTR